MPIIKLTRGKEAVVSSEDYDSLMSQRTWYCTVAGYAISTLSAAGNAKIYMHRAIAERMAGQPIPDGYEVDHINGNRLDNRRENLRLVTHSQNMMNASSRQNRSSKYKGVSWDKVNRRWRAVIFLNKKQTSLGRHDSEEAAAKAYDAKAKELFGEYARLNFP